MALTFPLEESSFSFKPLIKDNESPSYRRKLSTFGTWTPTAATAKPVSCNGASNSDDLDQLVSHCPSKRKECFMYP